MSEKTFIHDDFLLETKEAVELYHGYAKGQPIIDYHTHLPPQQVAENTRWENLTQVWLYEDHYKWRALRSNGVDEAYITGSASDREKFDKWAETMPYLLRNPLYHWTHLELARYFGVDDLLSPETADAIWEKGKERLADPALSARGLIRQSNVRLICTTDDPCDTLAYHDAIAADEAIGTKVLPTWRPDKALTVDQPDVFNEWAGRLAEVSGVEIKGYVDFMEALGKRHDYFAEKGGMLADHGIDTFYAEPFLESELVAIFGKVRESESLSAEEVRKWRSGVMYELGVMNHRKGWVQQFHFGPMRNNSSRILDRVGPDAGVDSMNDLNHAVALSRYLDSLDRDARLTKTILYNLNPRDNAMVASMIGNFQDGSCPGKIQMGSAWWFGDSLDGMTRQIENLSSMGLLSRFVGMLTDSRSFLSFTRHEYFRRILCNILGDDMARGRIPSDLPLVGRTVEDICFNNSNTLLYAGGEQIG